MLPNASTFFVSCRIPRYASHLVALLGAILLLPASGQAASGTCGIAAGIFQIDGQFYSAAPNTDWAQGSLGNAVFANDGSSVITPSLRARDGHWGGHEDDFDAFSGSGNKNNDDISELADPWTWGKGSGPAKNDLTDVYASSAQVDGDVWLFLGAATRTTNGASHVDFEISQSGFQRTGETSGTIVGLGPDAGRTAGVDFIVSVDYEDGGTFPVVSFRTWELGAAGYEFVETPQQGADVFICTNDETVPAPPWGFVDPDGAETTEVLPYQFIEIGLNLTSLGIDPSIFCTDLSTLMFKTRSSPSFTSSLKDLTIHQFSLVPPPPSEISADRSSYCAGDVARLCAPSAAPEAQYRYEWQGPGGPYADTPCISTDLPGTYRLVVHDLDSGCSGESTFDLVMNEPPVPEITFDTDVICSGGAAEFCGPQPRSGSVYQYEWSGPGGPFPDASCIQVSEAGVYTLTVTDLTTGCTGATGEHSLTVNPLPVAAISGVGLICAGTSTELCGPEGDYDYLWEGPGDAFPNQRCITVSDAGTYRLALTNRATGCVGAAATHDLTVTPVPVAAIAGPASVCPDSDVELCGPEGDLVYTWDGPNGPYAPTRCIRADAPGRYTLTIENPNGCASSVEHELTLDETLAVSEMSDLFLCTGARGEFCVAATGTGPMSYVWSKDGNVIAGATDACFAIPSISAADVGEYTVEVQGKCGPAVTRAASLTLADVVVAGVRDAYLCEGQFFELCPEVSGLGPFSYEWVDVDRNVTVSTEPCLTIRSVKPRHEGTFSLTVRGACGNPVVVDFRLRVGGCDQFCSKSKGFWGNPGGTWDGMRTIEVLEMIITPSNPIVLGKLGQRSVTIGNGAEHCVIEFLPADGPALALDPGLGDGIVDGETCGESLGITSGDGKLQNGLLAATLVTELNLRLDPRLSNMRVCAEMITVPALPGPDGQLGTADDVPDASNPNFYSMPQAVLDALKTLGLRDSVGGLAELANLGLAGAIPAEVPVSLSQIEAALNAIVLLTHDCALVIECEYPGPPGGKDDEPLFSGPGGRKPVIADPSDPAETIRTSSGELADAASGTLPGVAAPANAYLNSTNPVRRSTTIRFGMPEAGRTRIVVYDVRGRAVANLVDRTVAAGHHAVDLNIGRHAGMSAGVYFVRMESESETGDRFSRTRKIVVIR
jgi:hypothetical protein